MFPLDLGQAIAETGRYIEYVGMKASENEKRKVAHRPVSSRFDHGAENPII
jgi:hypothetical protein